MSAGPRAKYATYAEYLDTVASPDERRGFVYFAGPLEGPIKVGFTNNVAERLRGLQTASPVDLVLWAVIPGTLTCEAAWHDVLADERVRGEWFALSERTARAIIEVRKLAGPMPGYDLPAIAYLERTKVAA
jgi:hypothetical protein